MILRLPVIHVCVMSEDFSGTVQVQHLSIFKALFAISKHVQAVRLF